MAIQRVPNRERELLRAMLAHKARRGLSGPASLLLAQPTRRSIPAVAEARPAEKPTLKPLASKVKNVPTYAGAQSFMEGMIRRGWTPEEAAGAAGNVHVESGFQSGIKSSVPNESSFGFLQWNKERLTGLKNMADQTGRDWRDPDTQMDYIHMERTGDSTKYGGADESRAYKRAFDQGGSPAEIAERFGRFVERPLDLSASVDTRRKAADQYAPMAKDVFMSIFGG